MEQLFCYSCHMHVHSTFSDGHGSPEEILSAAQKAGIDIVCLTDHHTLEPLRRGWEGWHGRTLLLVGTEIGEKANHYLAFNLRRELPANDDDPQQVIDAVRSQGGFGFLAHPFERGSSLFLNGSHFPWNNWQVKGYAGLELWNYCSQWREAVRSYRHGCYHYLFNRHRLVASPPPQALSTWDKLCRQRPVVGICGSDAHALPLKAGPFTASVFPYPFLFRSMNNHLLLRQPLRPGQQQARALVYQALRRGNLFFALDALAHPQKFRCGAFNGSGEKALPGEKITFDRQAVLYAFNPSPRGTIRIIKNGELVYEKKIQNLYFHLLSPGIYRVEVYYTPRFGRPRPWIYANPIYAQRR